MISKFHEGQRVICVDSTSSANTLIKGHEYIVDRVVEYPMQHLGLFVGGIDYEWHSGRFLPVGFVEPLSVRERKLVDALERIAKMPNNQCGLLRTAPELAQNTLEELVL